MNQRQARSKHNQNLIRYHLNTCAIVICRIHIPDMDRYTTNTGMSRRASHLIR